MTDVRTSLAIAILAAGVTAAMPASAQPSKAETDAVRSNCRSDYMAKCMSVKPGGIEAIQCLKKNDASLSSGCRSAVAAIKLPGETPEPAPASPPPAAAAPAPSPQPAPAAAAPKPAAPATAAVPEPSKPVPPKPAQAKPAATPKPAVATAPPAPAPVAAPPPAAASSEPKIPTLPEAILVRRFCTTDYQVLCKGTPIGGGRVIQCLSANQPALSPNCKEAIAKAQ